MDILLMELDTEARMDLDFILHTHHHTVLDFIPHTELDSHILLSLLLFPTLMDLDTKLLRSMEAITTSDNPDTDLNHLHHLSDLDQEDSEDLEDERDTDPRPTSMSLETTTSSRWIFPDINAITSTSSLLVMSSMSSQSPLLELTTSTSTRDLLDEATLRESSICPLTSPALALLPY